MTTTRLNLTIDGQPVAFSEGQTIVEAARAAGVFVPTLCYHPEFAPHGSCKLCQVIANGRSVSACTTLASDGMVVENNTPELQSRRRETVRMLFVEGNHFCPGCEKSGQCQLQAVAYHCEMMSPHYEHFYPNRALDASHPDILLDFNRCIMCELCVKASRDVDHKEVFSLVGRGMSSRVVVNSPSGQLGDSDFAATDKAAEVCPVGVILHKRVGFAKPIGERVFDLYPIEHNPLSFQHD